MTVHPCLQWPAIYKPVVRNSHSQNRSCFLIPSSLSNCEVALHFGLVVSLVQILSPQTFMVMVFASSWYYTIRLVFGNG